MPKEAAVSIETLTRRIRLIRGQKVMLDSDLAELYGVPTKRLNEQVRRNQGRFPSDFVFQLSADETSNLRSQIATSSYGGRRHAPLAFTEHGAIMAAAVLNSRRAIQMNVFVVRAFVQLRELLSTHRLLASKLQELSARYPAKVRTSPKFSTSCENSRLSQTRAAAALDSRQISDNQHLA